MGLSPLENRTVKSLLDFDGGVRALVSACPAVGAGIRVDDRDLIHLDGIAGAGVLAKTASDAVLGFHFGDHWYYLLRP